MLFYLSSYFRFLDFVWGSGLFNLLCWWRCLRETPNFVLSCISGPRYFVVLTFAEVWLDFLSLACGVLGRAFLQVELHGFSQVVRGSRYYCCCLTSFFLTMFLHLSEQLDFMYFMSGRWRIVERYWNSRFHRHEARSYSLRQHCPPSRKLPIHALTRSSTPWIVNKQGVVDFVEGFWEVKVTGVLLVSPHHFFGCCVRCISQDRPHWKPRCSGRGCYTSQGAT